MWEDGVPAIGTGVGRAAGQGQVDWKHKVISFTASEPAWFLSQCYYSALAG